MEGIKGEGGSKGVSCNKGEAELGYSDGWGVAGLDEWDEWLGWMNRMSGWGWMNRMSGWKVGWDTLIRCKIVYAWIYIKFHLKKS